MLLCFCIVSGIASAFYLARVLKGHTGDTYGAVVELSEAGALLWFALFFRAF
jgi:cobalamin synthase